MDILLIISLMIIIIKPILYYTFNYNPKMENIDWCNTVRHAPTAVVKTLLQ